jgi:hypothetical protein
MSCLVGIAVVAVGAAGRIRARRGKLVFVEMPVVRVMQVAVVNVVGMAFVIQPRVTASGGMRVLVAVVSRMRAHAGIISRKPTNV